jgi:hypothetical protein
VSMDHVLLLVSIPPQMTNTRLAQRRFRARVCQAKHWHGTWLDATMS